MDVLKKYRIEIVLNKVLALVAVITFFGYCSRDFKVNAPTIFALASILVYTSIKSILNLFSDKRHTKELMKEIREEHKKKKKELEELRKVDEKNTKKKKELKEMEDALAKLRKENK